MALTKVSKELFNTDTVFAVDSIGGKYGSSSAPISIAVTVGTKTAAHPYNGDGSSLAYFLDGIESPALQLNGADNVTSDSGYYYRFDQSDSTNSSHPLRFYLDADKTTAYTSGVTTNGTAGSAGAYTQIDVDEDTPSILYYQCSSHAYMGNYALVPASNVINHTEALISMPTATTTLVGTGTTDTLTNKTLTTPTITTPVVNAGLQLKNGATSAGFIEFFEDSDNGTNKVTLIGPAATADITLTLPSSDGDSGQVMTTNGSGTLSFSTVGGAYSDFTLKTTNYTAVAKDQLICNHASTPFTITLPSGPTAMDTVLICNAGAATVTVARNSSNINSLAQDATLVQNTSAQLVYVDSTIGWFVI